MCGRRLQCDACVLARRRGGVNLCLDGHHGAPPRRRCPVSGRTVAHVGLPVPGPFGPSRWAIRPFLLQAMTWLRSLVQAQVTIVTLARIPRRPWQCTRVTYTV